MALFSSQEEALKVINHVFLPPQLPQKEDPSEGLILDTVTHALSALPTCVPSEASPAIRNAIALLSNLKAVHSMPEGEVSEIDLHRTLCNLQPGQTMGINVSAQNAAVLITHEQDRLIFEQFELSPRNNVVFSTPGRLVRTFPKAAVALKDALLKDQQSDFAKEICNMLATMSSQTVPEMQPQTKKAGTHHAEIRDSEDPFIVSMLLFNMLRGFGESHSSSTISKNTREEVLWKDALHPWRRSPMWLFIRVSLQLVISRSADGSHTIYKQIILFVMSHILDSAHRFNLQADLLYVMNAKIDRRRQKLVNDVSPQDPVMTFNANVLRRSHDVILARWTKVQADNDRNVDMQSLRALKFEEDRYVSIPALDSYIEAINSRQSSADLVDFKPSTGILPYDSYRIPSLPSTASGNYAVSNLQQFETWVAEHLARWITERNSNEACEQLCAAIKKYHTLAKQLYAKDPEGISIMLLTIMELWVACDMAAARDCSLLAEYDPGISSEALQNLLLPFMDQMQRLSKVEGHLNSRKRNGGLRWSLLFDTSDANSFANRFYRGSRKHQLLFERITSRAERDKEAKLEHFERMKSQYLRLDALYHGENCEYITTIVDAWCDPPETETVHSSSCQKCKYRRQRDKLSIGIFEWPLPANQIQAQVVVFELEIPPWLAHWRDARFYILHEVLAGTRARNSLRASYELSSSDPHLTKDYFKSKRHRIGLVSEDKPAINTHYRVQNVLNADESRICVRNGMTYHYFDSTTTSYVGEFAFGDQLPRACTYKLPKKSKALEQFLFRPASFRDGRPPNHVIASQKDCPPHLSLAEYKELSQLPLDFKKEETTVFFLQCIYQAGPPSSDGDALRQAHCVLRNNATLVVKNLTTALERVKKNWESSQALNTFVTIATRILSANVATKAECFSFLGTARHVAIGWMQALRDKAFATGAHADRTEFISKSIEVALICALTFNVDDQYLAEILRSPEDASILVRACIVVREGEHAQATRAPHVDLLYLRFRRLLFRCYKILALNSAGLDIAIKLAWPSYARAGRGWALAPGTGHWVTTITAASGASSARQVHYDLLSGELLVNGLPIDQPPTTYRSQPLFKTLFGQAVVEVMPASKSGFEFSTQRQFGGSQVEIGMNNGSLIVQATKAGRTFETIPSSMLQGVYPRNFVHDYVLWYSASANIVELRSVDDPWNSESSRKWTLLQYNKSRQWSLTRDSVHLLGLKCKTTGALGRILQPLAHVDRVHCLLQRSDGLLHVEIPTLQLGFSLAEETSDLRSREYRSMSVDQNQVLGTLIGYSNKLILKGRDSDSRLAMILEGGVAFSTQGDHVSARVLHHAESKVHAVRVNEALHRLEDSGDLDCKIYLAYLHAITSFCLPDPLTLRTGTEEALTILKSKAVESFVQLSQANVDLLGKIADLTPGRRYYPAHLHDMQQVDWRNDLSVLSQHGHFSAAVSNLFEQATFAETFFPDISLKFPILKNVERDLRTRDAIRSSTFRVSNFGAEDFDASYDLAYTGRDNSSDKTQDLPERCHNVATMAELLFRKDDTIHWPTVSTDALWNLISVESSINGVHLAIDESYMRYNAKLLLSGFRSAVARFPALHRWLKDKQASPQHTFAVTIWLATLAFAKGANMAFLQIFAMSYKFSDLAKIDAPSAQSFAPKQGRDFSSQQLKNSISAHQKKFADCPEYKLTRGKNEKSKEYSNRCENAWRNISSAKINQVVDALTAQWPCEDPTTPKIAAATVHIDMDGVMGLVKTQYKAWYDNGLLYRYISEIQQSISRLSAREVTFPVSSMQSPIVQQSLAGYVSEDDLFAGSAPKPLANVPASPLSLEQVQASSGPSATPRLESAIQELSTVASASTYERKYIDNLQKSLRALDSEDKMDSFTVRGINDDLGKYIEQCNAYIRSLHDGIVAAMCSSAKSQLARGIQRLPRISPMFLLRQLAHDRWSQLPAEWQKCIIDYGVAWTALQQAQRLSTLTSGSRKDERIHELCNIAHANWKPIDHPEWLLIEVESGITIRKNQIEIAGHMQNPASRSNAVIQLNMGEGKSSVIVPIVAAALANSSQLVRVVVAKPQSKQMAQMLISKFGGLVNRRIYYLPFSRSIRLTRTSAEATSGMLHECMTAGGILLVQPEHLLSFKLMALECFIKTKSHIGQSIASTQQFLDDYSRDIVDEADENFSTKFELIYTIGSQTAVEMSPDRWLLVQQVLQLVKQYAPPIHNAFKSSLEITPGPLGSFPRIRLLRDDAETELLKEIAHHIIDHGLDGFRLNRQTAGVREAVYTYITKRELSAEEITAVQESQVWTDTTCSHLLMLRGLLALGVLGFSLGQKRYRVNYGLTIRTPATKLAVPYRAKDSPAPRSEFSHPDVVILLTLLSYYYQGLDDEDLFAAFGHLVSSDQAETEYQTWVNESHALPAAFKQLQGINLKDRTQCTEELFPLLRHNKSVVDYFLAHLVFPKEMKEFPSKLSTSGWDIGKQRELLTTGFTGTVDSHPLLPLSMEYPDLPKQRHTNALVLEYLLQPENGVHEMADAGATSDSEHLLSSVMRLDPTPQVILDLGAQVLELGNLEMAKTWLGLSDGSKEAVIFVNSNDEICIVDRNDRITLWQNSSYQSRPDACLVFLDEAHTRGTDLQLPTYYRAAVTLGARVTKDRLVQACMRMRGLGKGQSVVFCISQEIQTKIRDSTKKSRSTPVEVADVLVWSIRESHAEIRRNMPLWATQGERFVRQEKLWKAARSHVGELILTKKSASKFLEKEGQTIGQRYRPRTSPRYFSHLADAMDVQLQQIGARCREFDDLQYDLTTLHEEQERELSPEIEQERQIERAPSAKPITHELHRDVVQFAMEGVLVSGSKAYMPAFSTLQQLSAWKMLAKSRFGYDCHLLATADFARTVESRGVAFVSDNFLRPVQWVLTRCATDSNAIDCIMVVSPYEANQLYSRMKTTSATTLHLYKPRVNSSYASLDALDFHSVPLRSNAPLVPRSLAVQLNLFAGQLYITSFEDYEAICKVLGLLPQKMNEAMEKQGWKIQANGFILSDDQGRIGGESKLKKSPVPFLKALMSIRRNGDDISKTHMGGLLEGKLFEPSDFEA